MINPQPATSKYPLTWWDALILVIAAGYILTWGNRYLSPTVGSGSELVIARDFFAGRLPYRDYFYTPPPVTAMWAAAVVWVCGPYLIPFWIAGGVLRLAVAWVLYRWLLRIGRPGSAAAATLTTLLASCADIPDYLGWYNYYPPVWAVFAGFCVTKRLETPSARGWVWVAATGLVLGVNFLTKQTTGGIVGVAVVAAAGYATLRLRGWRAAVTDTLGVLAVAAVPVAAVSGWLAASGALGAYIDQSYIRGPSSKGGLTAALLRSPVMTVTYGIFAIPALLGLAACCVGGLAGVAAGRPVDTTQGTLSSSSARMLVGVAAVFAALLVIFRLDTWLLADSRSIPFVAVYATQFGTCWIMSVAFVESLRESPGLGPIYRGIMGAIGFSLAYALSMSWPMFEPMMMPGLAVCLTLGLEQGRTATNLGAVRVRPAWLTICALLAAIGAWRKYTLPSSWGMWNEPPIWQATVAPSPPPLWGFLVGPETARFYNRVSEVIRDRTAPDDTILATPNLTIVYALTDRKPAASALLQVIDFCPDSLAEADARSILANPPKVIVELDVGDDSRAFEEMMYRGGKKSGQRELLAAVQKLTAGYELVDTFESPAGSLPVRLWVRKD